MRQNRNNTEEVNKLIEKASKGDLVLEEVLNNSEYMNILKENNNEKLASLYKYSYYLYFLVIQMKYSENSLIMLLKCQ